MPILKFWNRDGKITLDKLVLQDISNDKRTALIPTHDFLNTKYKIDDNVYCVVCDTFFRMAKVLSATPIHAMLITNGVNSIIIVPNKSYVFWNGHSVNPYEYQIIKTQENLDIQHKIEHGQI